MADDIHLVKVPLRADRLAAVARRRGIPLRDFDEGYLVHCVLRELWQDKAPAPFVLRGRGRWVDAWGYSGVDAKALREHARAFADPELIAALGELDDIATRPMPVFATGQRVGFLLRSCPVVRLAKARNGHRAGAEVDAFLAECFNAGDEVDVEREGVYRRWLIERLSDVNKTGVTVERISVAGLARTRLIRRTQGELRKAKPIERPDVRFEGDLRIEDGKAFRQLLARGIGRHRAFGFGALIVVAPGTSYPRN